MNAGAKSAVSAQPTRNTDEMRMLKRSTAKRPWKTVVASWASRHCSASSTSATATEASVSGMR